jgi:hypothetical protein
MNDACRANIAAIIVILLAGALSSVWAFLVPIFQAPDEPAHFDYAISIYSAGRLIRLSDGRPDWIVSPYTKYLMRATDFERIVWRSSMRVPAGYGSRPYFARVDAGAPSRQEPLQADGRISYIVRTYPFGFYAMEALWMRAASLFTPSLTAIFFAARLLCVFLTMLGLYFNYRTALNLGVPRWIGVALVAAIGLFPMTSLVSSYIQPDNLAYLLVSAALFFATRLSRVPTSLPDVAAAGLALGLLAITKYQFFVSTAVPIGVFFAVRSLQSKSTVGARISATVLLVLPTVALWAVQHWFVDQSLDPSRAFVSSDMNAQYFRGVLAQGSPAALHYLISTSLNALTDFFVWGGASATFWQMLGWVDTPLVILNDRTEMWIRSALAATSLAAALALTSYLLRNIIRLSQAATRRHIRLALDVAVANPVLNSYLCFIAIMLALYVLTNDAFGAEGRQWYPYIFPSFLCFIWYAPRALRRQHRAVSATFAAALLGYVLVASGYALADVTQRYYGPQLAQYAALDPTPSNTLPPQAGVLSPVASAAYHVNSRETSFAFPRGSRLLVDGAALSPDSHVVPSTVAVMLDGTAPVPVLADQYLFLIAEATHSIADGYSGFYGDVDTRSLREGAHTLAAYAQLPERGRYARIAPTRLFFVTGADGQLAPAFMHSLDRGALVRGRLEIGGSCRGVVSSARGIPSIAPGGVLLFTGRVQQRRGARDYSAVWMSVDRRPYPAIYNADDRTFVGTIPTLNLAPGLHQLVAYALSSRAPRNFRISQTGAFRIVPGRDGNVYLAEPPAICTDSLRELAGT